MMPLMVGGGDGARVHAQAELLRGHLPRHVLLRHVRMLHAVHDVGNMPPLKTIIHINHASLLVVIPARN